jgi:hypothetical protein
VCFTVEIGPAQLIDAHSLTARPTQVSLCTCCVKKICCLVSSCANPIKAIFLSIDPVSNLHKLSCAHPNRSHVTTSLFTWIWNFFLVNHVVALSSKFPDPLMILPYYLVICYNLFSSIECLSCLNLSFLARLISPSLRIMTFVSSSYL